MENPGFEERWALSQGLRLRYLVREGSGRGALVFIHGLGGRLETWQPVLQRLAALTGHTLVALDLRGFGKSQEPSSLPGLDDFATDVTSVMDDIGVDEALLVGSSMGGMVAVRTASRAPGRVKGLVLADTGPRVRVDKRLLYRALKGDTSALKTIVERVSLRLSKRTPTLTSLFSGNPDYVLGVLERVEEEDISMEVALLDKPLLVLVGREDPVTPPSLAAELAALSMRARLELIPGARHLSHVDNPSLFAQLTARFADEVLRDI